MIRIMLIKLKCGSRVKIYPIQPMRVRSEMVIQNKVEKVLIGRHFKLETDAKLRVIDGGFLEIGDNCFINCNSYITVMGKTKIGNNCMIGPNVMIFDHDHDYMAEGGIAAGKTSRGEIIIGNNVWIGASCCILKGAVIEDGAVIAAGSVVKGHVGADTLFYQKRLNISREIKRQ